MKVQVTARFQDRQTGQYHDAGEVLDWPADRAQAVIACGCGQAMVRVAEVPAEPNETESEPPRRKRRGPPEDKAARATEDKELFAD